MSSTPIVPTWRAEFDSRISAFSEALGVEEAKVREVLTDYGADGETSQSLDIIDNEQALPMAELFQMFVDSGLTKKGRLRLAVPHLRGSTTLEEPSTTTESEYLGTIAGAMKDIAILNRPKSDWSDRELLEAYDEDSSEVWEILRKRSHGRPFVIFAGDGTVNIDESLKLLKIAKKQPTTNKHRVNGKLVSVRRAGEFLTRMLNESPFCRGLALVDGYCSKSDTNWDGVCDEARVICHLHAFKVETAKLSKREMKAISKTAKDLAALRDELSEAALMYDELKEQDSLPKLKIREDKVRSEPYSGKIDTGF